MTIDRLPNREDLRRGDRITEDIMLAFRDQPTGDQEPFNPITGEKEGDTHDLGTPTNRWRNAHFSGFVNQGKPAEPATPVVVNGDGSVSNINYQSNVSTCTIRFQYTHTSAPSQLTAIRITLPWDWEGGIVKLYESTNNASFVNGVSDRPFHFLSTFLALNDIAISGHTTESYGESANQNLGYLDKTFSPLRNATNTTIDIRPYFLNATTRATFPKFLTVIVSR